MINPHLTMWIFLYLVDDNTLTTLTIAYTFIVSRTVYSKHAVKYDHMIQINIYNAMYDPL